jgi:hypothetical protein
MKDLLKWMGIDTNYRNYIQIRWLGNLEFTVFYFKSARGKKFLVVGFDVENFTGVLVQILR